MKTLLTLAMASAISFSSLAANDDLKDLSTVNSHYQKISVTLKGGVGDAKITILNNEGKSLNSRKVHVKEDGLVVPYNMGELPIGEYQVKISTEDEEVTYKVETANKPIPVEELPLMAYGKKLDNNTVSLSVIGLTQPGVNVKIMNSKSGKVIHEDKVNQPEAFKKNYSFKSIKAEDVYLELTDALGRSKVIYF
ncbi:hypothetical protein [Algoriphagus machipongonensis]|uniref:Uncharacterized protein n=1 Tax=Algoriphagus machipongonensis TaxID=388413 RepID=A3HRZ2_9BACT|nr:hypothetical protein [Algoriphagus machipongonensis]EAZ82610.1 hypothetical protein ALPR1_10355 [Algoriphagus machipongonensis]